MTEDVVVLKHLGPADGPVLNRIAPDVFDHAIRADSRDAFLSCPRHVLIVALDDDLVVGMATGVEYIHPDKAPQFWINEVGVAPDYQRLGIGRRLVRALFAEAKRRGCSEAWLGTEPDNIPARACYDGLPGGEKPEPFVLYAWDLKD
ncbi:MAG: GNAT family N-acetyltransferase [Pseudomonadota bacterium]